MVLVFSATTQWASPNKISPFFFVFFRTFWLSSTIYYYKIVSAIITRSLIFLLRWEWVHFKVVKGQSCSCAMIACHKYMKGNFGFINLHVRRVVNYSSAHCKKGRAEVCREVAVLRTNSTIFFLKRAFMHLWNPFLVITIYN